MGRSSQVAKQATRERLVDAAGREFRLHGFGGIGVDGVAKAAGVTSGAVYAHFGSKAAIFNAALGAGLDALRDGIIASRAEHGAAWLRPFATWYLNAERRADLAGSCALPALSLEAARSDAPTQGLYEANLLAIAEELAAGLPERNRERNAWAILGLLTGGMTMAHAVAHDGVGERIAAGVVDAICALGEA